MADLNWASHRKWLSIISKSCVPKTAVFHNQYLFIGLLLASFAVFAMGQGDKTPNRREIALNSKPEVLCAGEKGSCAAN
jgi:hypothetical protein